MGSTHESRPHYFSPYQVPSSWLSTNILYGSEYDPFRSKSTLPTFTGVNRKERLPTRTGPLGTDQPVTTKVRWVPPFTESGISGVLDVTLVTGEEVGLVSVEEAGSLTKVFVFYRPPTFRRTGRELVWQE